MKYLMVVVLMAYINELSSVNSEDDSSEDLPVVSTKTVFDYITELMNSPQETLKGLAKDTLQNLKSQMDDKSKQYAKLTINGIRYAVNMGAYGSALRSENEALITQLWNFVLNLFYNVLSWLGFGNQDANVDDNVNSEVYYVEDVMFMIEVLQQQLTEITAILKGKLLVMEHVNNARIVISESIGKKIIKENFFEIKYKNKLEKSIRLLQDELENIKRKQNGENK